MDKLKLALLGCGDVAQRDYLPEFWRIADRAEWVAVCGRMESRVRAVAEQHAIPNWYTDYTQMLAEIDADAVVNLTPIQLHTETTLAALLAGKHVYTEKPVASTVADAQRIRTTALAAGRKLVCAPCVRLFPQVRRAQALLTDGAIGAVYSARGYGHMGVPPWSGYSSDPTPFFANGGGPARDMGVYPLHTLTTLLGPVLRVSAMVAKVMESFVVEDGPFAGKEVPVEADDNWQMILDFGGGRLATLAANNCVVATQAPQVELHGLTGSVALDPIDVSAPVELFRVGEGWQELAVERSGRQSGPDHLLGVEHLVDCVLHDREPVLSIDQALHVVEIIEKAALSSISGVVMSIESRF